MGLLSDIRTGDIQRTSLPPSKPNDTKLASWKGRKVVVDSPYQERPSHVHFESRSLNHTGSRPSGARKGVTTVSPTRSLRPPVIHSGRAAGNSYYTRPLETTAQPYSSLASDYGSRATSGNVAGAASAIGSSTATGITDYKQKLMDVLNRFDAKVVGVYDRGNVVGEIEIKTFFNKIFRSTLFDDDVSTKQVALRSGNDSRSDIILMTRYDGGESPSSITNGPLSSDFSEDLHKALLGNGLNLTKLVHLINENDVVGQ